MPPLRDLVIRDKYNGLEPPGVELDIERVRQGEPIDYVIGWSNFCGCRINLTARPLIPRVETEYWTDWLIKQLALETNKEPKVLDIFAGSGCIGIALLRHLPNTRVDFVDIDPWVLEGIRITAKLNQVSAAQFRLIQSDVFKLISDSYDLIVANPPYIPTGRKPKLDASVLDWEPHQALFAGTDGLEFIKSLFKDGVNFLKPSGKMIIEFDMHQKLALESLTEKYGWQTEFFCDQYARWRWLSTSRPKV